MLLNAYPMLSLHGLEHLTDAEFFLSSRLNNEISRQLGNWHHTHRTGYVGESNAGYQVTPGVVLSPDASWVSEERLSRLPAEDRRKFPAVCPDFVVELKSETDRLSELKAEMRRWLTHGIRLGWLIVPETETVFVYRPGTEPAEVNSFDHALAADPELPGFALDLTELRREMAR